MFVHYSACVCIQSRKISIIAKTWQNHENKKRVARILEAQEIHFAVHWAMQMIFCKTKLNTRMFVTITIDLISRKKLCKLNKQMHGHRQRCQMQKILSKKLIVNYFRGTDSQDEKLCSLCSMHLATSDGISAWSSKPKEYIETQASVTLLT